MYGGANTVVLPREKRFKISDNVSLPLFGEINLHLPDFFVIKMKKELLNSKLLPCFGKGITFFPV